MVRCKFKCITNVAGDETASIKLEPVLTGNAENMDFFKYTPAGCIEVQVVNPRVASQFEVGKEYYVDFTQAE